MSPILYHHNILTNILFFQYDRIGHNFPHAKEKPVPGKGSHVLRDLIRTAMDHYVNVKQRGMDFVTGPSQCGHMSVVVSSQVGLSCI